MPDAEAAGAECGIDLAGWLAVGVTRRAFTAGDAAADRAAALRSLSAVVDGALALPGLGRLVDIRDEEIIAVLCGSAQGVAAAAASAVGSAAGRAAAAIGVSLDVHDIAEPPQAYADAQRL